MSINKDQGQCIRLGLDPKSLSGKRISEVFVSMPIVDTLSSSTEVLDNIKLGIEDLLHLKQSPLQLQWPSTAVQAILAELACLPSKQS